MNADYEWMKFYEAAVLETNTEALDRCHIESERDRRVLSIELPCLVMSIQRRI